jgi:amino-acid N-acetyltransferase
MQVLEADVSPKLSQARPDDLPSVLALLRQCELLETGVAEAFERFVVARRGASTVGCAGFEVYAGMGLLRSVAVDPCARRSGLGEALVGCIVAAARESGLRDLYLLTTTAPQFFERIGFGRIPRAEVPAAVVESWEFRVGCPQTAQAMRLALQE